MLLSALSSCNGSSNHAHNSNTTNVVGSEKNSSVLSDKQTDSVTRKDDIEEKVIDTIFKLTEVKQRASYIEQQTKGARHLKVWTESSPDLPERKFYWMKVGEDNGTNLVTHFNFYVYPNSMRIMYYDINDDKEMTLEAWRKQPNGQ